MLCAALRCKHVRKLLSTLLDTSRSLRQNTVASLNSYRSRVRVKLTRFVRSVGYLHRTRREGQHKNATPKTASQPVFCFVSMQCLVYYFLLFLDPNFTISYLAMLAGMYFATLCTALANFSKVPLATTHHCKR